MAKGSAPLQDLKTELASGDPVRQSRALLAVLGLVSAGRDPGPQVIGTICSRVLGAPNTPPSLRVTAYDIVAASTPSDAEYVHLTNAIASDLTEGTPDEVSIKALGALPSLPPSYLADLMVLKSRSAGLRARLRAILGAGSNVSAALKATALEVLAEVLLIERITNLCELDTSPFKSSILQEIDTDNVENKGHESSGPLESANRHPKRSLGALVEETIDATGRGLTDQDPLVVAASCRALTFFLASAISAYRASTSRGVLSNQHSGDDDDDGNGNDEKMEEELEAVGEAYPNGRVSGGGGKRRGRKSGIGIRMQAGRRALYAVSVTFGAALSRFRSLPVTYQPVVPPLLSTFIEAARLGEENRPLDTLPGEINSNSVWNQVGHIVDESAATLGGMIAGGDPTTILAAMQALFEILSSSSLGWGGAADSITAATLLPTATEAALSAAKAAAGSFSESSSHAGRLSRAAIMQSAILRLLLRYLDVLPPAQRSDLLPHLLPAIATVPIADDRVQSLYRLWMAVLSHDWTTSSLGPAAVAMANSASRRLAQRQKEKGKEKEKERRQRARQIQQQQLQQLHSRTSMLQALLSDAAVKGAVSGGVADMNPNVPYQRDPVLREELVASLLYVVLSHPQAAESSLNALTSLTSSSSSGSLSAISGASVLQSVVSAADWLASAEVALRGTKACLGWDRAGRTGPGTGTGTGTGTTSTPSSPQRTSTSGGPQSNDPKNKNPNTRLNQTVSTSSSSTGTTAAADLWLQLLLRCIHVGRALSRIREVYGPRLSSSVEKSNEQVQEEEGLQDQEEGLQEEEVGGLAGAIDVVARYGTELEAGFQGMMLQIVGNWRALHPGVRPRALWLCASHLHLKSVVDGAWMSLADALRGLMMTHHQFPDPHHSTNNNNNSSSSSSLSSSGSATGALASGRLTAGMGPSSYSGRGREDEDGVFSNWRDQKFHAASVAAAAGEREEVALLALERLAALVAASFSFFSGDRVVSSSNLYMHRTRTLFSRGGKQTRSLLEGLAGVAGLLDALASVILTGDSERGSKVDVVDRLARVRSLLAPVIARRKSRLLKKQLDKEEEKDDGEKLPPVVIELDDSLLGETRSASYPSTLTPFSSLQSTPQASRYRKLLDQLQAAALARAVKASINENHVSGYGDGSVSTFNFGNRNRSRTMSNAMSSLPDPLDLPTRCNLGLTLTHGPWERNEYDEHDEQEEEEACAGEVVVTGDGSSSPISLIMSHSVDPGAQVVRLKCKVVNETAEAIDGVKVTLLAGGPVAPWHRRPMTYELGCLMPNYRSPVLDEPNDDHGGDEENEKDGPRQSKEGGMASSSRSSSSSSRGKLRSVQWEVSLRIAGFGWPRVQAFLSLPVVSSDSQSGITDFSVRCAPYSVSPLDLLAPPLVSLSPAEFYQRWQALPHKLGLTIEVESKAVEQVLASIEAAGLSCIMKNVLHQTSQALSQTLSQIQSSQQTSVGVHAAFYGAAWTGESIAIVVSDTIWNSTAQTYSSKTSKNAEGEITNGQRDAYITMRLTLHIGSESGAIVGHLRGRETEILRRLMGGMKGVAIAAVGSPGAGGATAESWEGGKEKEKEKEKEEEKESGVSRGVAPSTFPGFLRTITMQMDRKVVNAQGDLDEDEDEDEDEVVEREGEEWRAVEVAALGGWRDLRKRSSVLVQ
jgi:hypothetical protein